MYGNCVFFVYFRIADITKIVIVTEIAIVNAIEIEIVIVNRATWKENVIANDEKKGANPRIEPQDINIFI